MSEEERRRVLITPVEPMEVVPGDDPTRRIGPASKPGAEQPSGKPGQPPTKTPPPPRARSRLR